MTTTEVACLVLLVLGFCGPAMVIFVYWAAKAATAGYLSARRMFFKRELKRSLRPEDLPDGDDE